MVKQKDTLKLRGIGVVTKWKPEDLEKKIEIEKVLITKGFEGAALEAEALRQAKAIGVEPYDVSQSVNTFVNGGTNIILVLLIGGSATAYTNAVSALGVGDSSAAFALTQTNLQGAVNITDRIRVAVNATYPSVSANVVTFQSTFSTSQANFQWNEWAIFNNVTDGSGTMLNRAVNNLGTKTSASAWQLTVTVTQS